MKLLLAILVVGTDALKTDAFLKGMGASYQMAAIIKDAELAAENALLKKVEEGKSLDLDSVEVKPLCNSGAQLDGGSWEDWGSAPKSREMSFLNLPGCKKGANLMYEPKSCSLPRFANEVAFQPKRVVFVGDSTQDSQARSYAWFYDELKEKDLKKCAHPILKMKEKVAADLKKANFSQSDIEATENFVGSQISGKKWNSQEWWGCESDVAFILADKPPPASAAKGFMHAVRNFYEKPLGPDDVVVMNFGLWMDGAHYKKQDGSELSPILKELKSWGKDAPKLIWREITPSHWNSWDGYYTPAAFRSTNTGCKAVSEKHIELMAKNPSGLRGKTNLMVKQAMKEAGMEVDGVNVEFVPVWKAAVKQQDDHGTLGEKSDCTHFCQNGSVNRFMSSALLSVAAGMMQRSKAPPAVPTATETKPKQQTDAAVTSLIETEPSRFF